MKIWLEFSSQQKDNIDNSLHVFFNGLVSTIAYFRFTDFNMITFCNNIPWFATYIENAIYTQHQRYQTEIDGLEGKKCLFIFRATGSEHSKLVELMNRYDMYTILSIYLRFDDNTVEMFGFASGNNQQDMYNYYLNNQDLLFDYIRYFKSIFLPNINELYFNHSYNLPISISRIAPQSNNVIMNDSIKKVYFNSTSYLTKREFECVKLVHQGYTQKEVAIKLEISARTVEKHLLNIKNKFETYPSSHLTNIIKKYQI